MHNNEGTFRELKMLIDREATRNILDRVLPDGTNVDAWISSALIEVRRTDDIAYATPKSTVGALITAASLGLQLEGPLGQAYFAAYKVWDRSKKPWQIREVQTQLQIGYRGLIQLAWRNREVQDLCARVVCKDDKFRFNFGTNAAQEHYWDHKHSRGPIVAVYAEILYKNGYYSFSEPYSVHEIDAVRKRALEDKHIVIEERDGEFVYLKYDRKLNEYNEMSPQQRSKVAWIAHYKPMAMKTAVRWASKFWRLGTQFERASSLVAIDDAGKSQQLTDVAQQYLTDAEHAKRTVSIGAGGSDYNADPEQPIAPLRPYDGAKGKRLISMMVAEAQGTQETAPKELLSAEQPVEITAEEEREILARERAEAAAYRQQMSAVENEDA